MYHYAVDLLFYLFGFNRFAHVQLTTNIACLVEDIRAQQKVRRTVILPLTKIVIILCIKQSKTSMLRRQQRRWLDAKNVKKKQFCVSASSTSTKFDTFVEVKMKKTLFLCLSVSLSLSALSLSLSPSLFFCLSFCLVTLHGHKINWKSHIRFVAILVSPETVSEIFVFKNLLQCCCNEYILITPHTSGL